MKRVGMIGKASRSKSFLMMYLGKILSQAMDVCLVTKDQWFIPDLETYEYSDRLTIEAEMAGNPSNDIILIDVTESMDEDYDLTVCITETDRLSVEANEGLFSITEKVENRIYLFMNMLLDSKINEKYLCSRLGIERKKEEVFSIYLDDGDMAVHVENGYNDRLDMRDLSKAYKKLLMTLARHCGFTDNRELKRWLRSAERSK